MLLNLRMAGMHQSTGEVVGVNRRAKDTACAEFWDPIFKDTDFGEFIKNQYSVDRKAELGEDFLDAVPEIEYNDE